MTINQLKKLKPGVYVFIHKDKLIDRMVIRKSQVSGNAYPYQTGFRCRADEEYRWEDIEEFDQNLTKYQVYKRV